MNINKFVITSQSQKQYVTGLSISDKKKPRLSIKFKRNLRLMCHLVDTLGIEEYRKRENLRSISKIIGQLRFSNHIEPDFVQKILPEDFSSYIL